MPTYYVENWQNKNCIIRAHNIEFKINSIPPYGIIGFCSKCKKTQYFNKLSNCNISLFETVTLVW